MRLKIEIIPIRVVKYEPFLEVVSLSYVEDNIIVVINITKL